MTLGSGNVFADIGIPDHRSHAAKAALVSIIARFIEEAGWTQQHAAERMGLSQPDVSKLLSGRFRSTSMEKLIGLLLKLGHHVTIDVDKLVAAQKRARLTVVDKAKSGV